MSEPIYCPSCGLVLEHLEARVAELEGTITQLGLETTRKTAQIKRLQAGQLDAHPPEYDTAMEIATYWKDLLAPNTKELRGPRLDRTIDRLQGGYDKEELRKAVFGYFCKPNIKDGKRVRAHEGGKRYADLELIMRDANRVDTGIALADAEQHFSTGHLNDGGSPAAARLCDCGHPRVDHGLSWKQGHEACFEQGCRCEQFDDVRRVLAEYNERQGHHNGWHVHPEPAQGKLL